MMVGTFSGRKLAQMPPRFGTCRVGEARWSDDAVNLARALLRTVGYDGIAQTEFKRDARDGTFRLMELNTRLWQWHSLARRCGVDLVGMAYAAATGGTPVPATSGPRHDGRRWVPLVPSWRAGRAAGEGRRTLLRQGVGRIEEPILSLRDPVPGARVVAGSLLGLVRRRGRA
jgi:predicted ATP-grasp superfamily ATP-dependent carboligase